VVAPAILPGVAKGNVKMEANHLPSVDDLCCIRYTIAQNLQIFKDTGPAEKLVIFNSVGENLQCFENDPPLTSVGNTARSEEGQCPPTP
jgi:hypothetical protein